MLLKLYASPIICLNSVSIILINIVKIKLALPLLKTRDLSLTKIFICWNNIRYSCENYSRIFWQSLITIFVGLLKETRLELKINKACAFFVTKCFSNHPVNKLSKFKRNQYKVVWLLNKQKNPIYDEFIVCISSCKNTNRWL